MNTFTRRTVGRKPAVPPCRSRHAFRTFILPGIGTARVSWWVAAGLYVGSLVESQGVRYIVPTKPENFPDAPLFLYSGPRPYWFYFYVEPVEEF